MPPGIEERLIAIRNGGDFDIVDVIRLLAVWVVDEIASGHGHGHPGPSHGEPRSPAEALEEEEPAVPKWRAKRAKEKADDSAG